MTISQGDFLFGVPALIPFAQGVDLSADNRLSTSSLMGSAAIQGNIAAASDLGAGGLKWEVLSGAIGVNQFVDRAEDSLVNLGQSGLYGEGKTQFSRYGLSLRSELSSGLFVDKTLYFTSEAAAESVLSQWPQISASDVDESKMERYSQSCVEVYEAAATIAAADHIAVDQVSCAGTLGGTSPRSDVVAKYGATLGDWAAGYSMSEDNYGLLLKADFATAFAKGAGVFQAAAGQDTTTGERFGTVLQVYDDHFAMKFSIDF